MAYIAFFDMVGTRASAAIGNNEYSDAIRVFHNALSTIADSCRCNIYGYSDNAYIETNDLDEMVKVFQLLRRNMQNNHLYFTAAVDVGTLKAKIKTSKGIGKGNIVSFNGEGVVKVYLQQTLFSGIGVSLSDAIIAELKAKHKEEYICRSIYQIKSARIADGQFMPVYDLAYSCFLLEYLEYLVADYILTAALNEQAGRYYVTPIVSLLRCISKEDIVDNVEDILLLILFRKVPQEIRLGDAHNRYKQIFLFVLLDRLLDFPITSEDDFDSTEYCKKIIASVKKDSANIFNYLNEIPVDVISVGKKRKLISILYNMDK